MKTFFIVIILFILLHLFNILDTRSRLNKAMVEIENIETEMKEIDTSLVDVKRMIRYKNTKIGFHLDSTKKRFEDSLLELKKYYMFIPDRIYNFNKHIDDLDETIKQMKTKLDVYLRSLNH